jgi:hypothetical protein
MSHCFMGPSVGLGLLGPVTPDLVFFYIFLIFSFVFKIMNYLCIFFQINFGFVF